MVLLTRLSPVVTEIVCPLANRTLLLGLYGTPIGYTDRSRFSTTLPSIPSERRSSSSRNRFRPTYRTSSLNLHGAFFNADSLSRTARCSDRTVMDESLPFLNYSQVRGP